MEQKINALQIRLGTNDLYDLADEMGIPIKVISSHDKKEIMPLLTGTHFAVANLDFNHSYSPGTHWVGMVAHNGTLYYYDCGGLPPSSLFESVFSNKKIYYNPFIHQANNDEACGFYSLAFIRFMANNNINLTSFNSFIHKFRNTLETLPENTATVFDMLFTP